LDTFHYIWRFMEKHKIKFICGLVLALISSMLTLVNPYVIRDIVNQIILPANRDMNLLLKFLSIMVCVIVIRSGIKYLTSYIFESISQDVVFKLRQDMYTKIQDLDFKFFDHTKTGDIMSKMTGDLDLVRHFTAYVLYASFEQTIIFIVGITVFFFIDWRFALIQLALVPALFYFTNGLTSHVRPAFYKIRQEFSKLNSVAQENISGNRVVKAFAKEAYEIHKFTIVNENFYRAHINSSKIWQKYLPPIMTLGGMFYVSLALVGGLLVIYGIIDFGELILANGLVWTLSNPINLSGWLINDWQRFFASLSKIRELMDEQSEITSDNYSIKKDIKGKVEFDKVHFSYDNQHTLQNISFKVYPGQTVAIIGPTGCGKSTLVSLICRFYDVTSGVVKIDDTDVRDINIRTLREKVSVAQQDIFLFSDTIEGNIAYGVPKATLEEVIRVAKIADAHEFILSMPEGYDTIIGERGVGLSGGQRQRIALARALLKNPSILILDDTTSSVDMETEHEIHKTLRSYYTDKTTFIIAHRISSVKNANLILVMDNGSIVERGTHNELVALGGKYNEVFENQFGDFNNEMGGEA